MRTFVYIYPLIFNVEVSALRYRFQRKRDRKPHLKEYLHFLPVVRLWFFAD